LRFLRLAFADHAVGLWALGPLARRRPRPLIFVMSALSRFSKSPSPFQCRYGVGSRRDSARIEMRSCWAPFGSPSDWLRRSAHAASCFASPLPDLVLHLRALCGLRVSKFRSTARYASIAPPACRIVGLGPETTNRRRRGRTSSSRMRGGRRRLPWPEVSKLSLRSLVRLRLLIVRSARRSNMEVDACDFAARYRRCLAMT